jgi:hypothetical protein
MSTPAKKRKREKLTQWKPQKRKANKKILRKTYQSCPAKL